MCFLQEPEFLHPDHSIAARELQVEVSDQVIELHDVVIRRVAPTQ